MARAAVIPPSTPPRKTGRGRPRTKTKAPAAEADATMTMKAKTTSTAKAKTTAAKAEPKRRVGRPASNLKKADVDESAEGTEDDEIGAIGAKEKGSTAKSRGTKAAGSTAATTTTTSAGRGRGRKPATTTPAPTAAGSDDDEDELAQIDVPKKRVGRPRTKPAAKEEGEAAAPRGRGRPRTGKAAKEAGSADGSAAKPVRITTNSTAMRSNIRQGPAKKKTVTFKDVSGSEAEDVDEEENLPAPAPAPAPARRRRGTGVQEGMGAKPVRKTATGAGRGRKPAAAKKGASKPLSPKKANQVTKTLSSYASSDGEEDELSGAKDQVELAVDSPTKHGSENIGSTSPVRRVNFTPNKPSKSVDENGEPTLHPARSIDFSDSVHMSSPARRPSASPFQFTMKETPRRGAPGFRDGTKSLAQPNLSPIQDSPLKSSPKKGNFGTSSMAMPQPNFGPEHSPLKASPKKGSPVKGNLGAPSLQASQPDFGVSSPLKTSPKKGKLGASFSQSPAAASTPFARSCLAQSPAKKVASPFKVSMTPVKAPLGTPAEIGSNNERRASAASDKIASESPTKAGTPRENDFGLDEVAHETSPAPEAQLHATGDDEFESNADDAIEMVEEPNAELQNTAEASDVDQAENHTEDHEEPGYPDDQPVDQIDNNVDALVDNEAEDEGNHAEYDAYDCTYLQDEVKDNIAECQRQLDHYSEVAQTNELDDRHSKPENSPSQSAVEVNQDDGLHASDIQSPQTPPRQSFPAGLEDVFVDTPAIHAIAKNAGVEGNKSPEPFEEDFVDTPASHGIAENAGVEDNKSPEPFEEDKVDESEDHFGQQDTHSDAGLEVVFVNTPASHGIAESTDVEDNKSPEPFEEDKVDEFVEDHFEQQDPHSDALDIDVDDQVTPMAFDKREPSSLISGATSPHDAPNSTERFDETTGDPVDAQIEEQGTPSVAQDVEEQESTRMASNEPEPYGVESGRASLFDTNENLEHENTSEEPADRQVDEQDVGGYGENCVPLDSPERRTDGSAPASPYEVYEADGTMTPSRIPPPVPTPPVNSAFDNHGDAFRDTGRYSMQSNDTTLFGSADTPDNTRRLQSPSTGGNRTPLKRDSLGTRRSIFKDSLGFTPLANQFSQWKASSPGKLQPEGRRRRGVFSLAGPRRSSGDIARDIGDVSYPDISKHLLADAQSLFTELPLQRDSNIGSEIYEDQEEPEISQDVVLDSVETERQAMSEIAGNPEHVKTPTDGEEATSDHSALGLNHAESPAPSVRSVHDEQEAEKENVPAGLSAPVTPKKNKINPMQTFHTVSKVPLKPEGDISPLKVSRKRGRSLSNASPTRSSPRLRKSIEAPENHDAHSCSPRKISKRPKRASHVGNEDEVPRQSETTDPVRLSASPAKSPRKSIGPCSQVLQGVVAHVDVHTTEGEDASGIFIELLQQMGARCVKNWAWNPRSGLSPVDGADPDSRVGITHVVFKDGGVRTIEKVRQASGLVKCVGVGWVLEYVLQYTAGSKTLTIV
jgi:hypothetical protein